MLSFVTKEGENCKENMAKATKTKGGDTAKRSVSSKTRKLSTTVTFTGNDLSALADYIAAGLVMLRIAVPHKAIGKLKAAMTRLKVPVTRGL
jgi:hypothetical protein